MKCKRVKRFSLSNLLLAYCTPAVSTTDTNPPTYVSSPAPSIAAKSQSGLQGSSICDTGNGEEKNEESKIGASLFLTDKMNEHGNKTNSHILSSPGNLESDQQWVIWVPPQKALA